MRGYWHKRCEDMSEFLIGSFSLAIGLGVIGSGQLNIILQEASKFSSKGQSKLRTTIKDECVMEAEAFEDIIKENLDDSCGIDDF